MARRRNFPLLTGSASRTLVLLAAIGSATACALVGTIDGAVYSGIVGAVVGGVVHASGTKQGSEATSAPPPPE
jgi:hypothetical protein